MKTRDHIVKPHPRLKRALLSAATLLISTLGHAGELRVGTAAVTINPPEGIGLAGYYHERGNEGVLDDLFAKAAVLDDGNTQAAIVVCDLISMPRGIVEQARTQIEARTGIPGDHVMIGATHTHTAPVLRRDSSRDELDGGAKPISAQYSAAVAKWIADAVAAAHEKREAVQLSIAAEHEDQLAYNRRFWMRDGAVGWNPGRLNPNIVRPAGPIDPSVDVLYAESLDGRKPILTFVNYALHPDTTGGARVSADYPGALARALAQYKGPEMLTLFANGTCGNINHIDVKWSDPQKGAHEANRLGISLAAAVFKAYPRLEPLEPAAPLQVRTELVKLPLAPFTDEELEQARADVRTARDNNRVAFMKLVRAHRVLDTAAREGRPMEVEMQVIALGTEVAWVAWPGEIFVELGLSVKAGSPFRHTYNVTLANGSIGYIPNKSAYPEGNYEVESARVAAGSGEMLVTSALRMLAELHKSAAEKGASE